MRSLRQTGLSTGTEWPVVPKRHTPLSPSQSGSRKPPHMEVSASIRENPSVTLTRNASSAATTTNNSSDITITDALLTAPLHNTSSAMTATNASLASPPTTTSSATMSPNASSAITATNVFLAASPPNASSATSTTPDFDAKVHRALVGATPLAQMPSTPESRYR